MNCVDYINGQTNVYSVIGYPIKHSFSPVIHNTIAKFSKHNIAYVPFEVNPSGLKEAILGAYQLNIKGINVTIPHKQQAIEYLCDIDEFAKQIGAVNTLKYQKDGYKGYNTDFYGLKSCLDSRKIELKDKIAALIGAGGAAKSAAIMLASQNIKKLWIINRTSNNAYLLAQNVKKYYNIDIEILTYNELQKIDKLDLCIQTTSVGMSPDIENNPIPSQDFYKKINTAVDIIFNPWQTKFLKEAKRFGCQTINGFDMLYFQAVKSYEIWFNISISNSDKEQIKQILELYYNHHQNI